MVFNNYTDGKRNIRATPVMFEMLYKSQGFKPAKASGKNDKGTSNRSNIPKDSTAETDSNSET